jgi:hypothetical protein
VNGAALVRLRQLEAEIAYRRDEAGRAREKAETVAELLAEIERILALAW